MRHAVTIVTCLICATAGAADSQTPDPKAPAKTVAAPPEGQTPIGFRAELKPTQGNTVSGELNLISEKSSVRVGGLIQGLKPNTEQAFHIHEKGDCSAPDASSAGGHFNPTSQPHGNPKGTGAKHAGDMVNLKSDAKGVAKVDVMLDSATLQSGQPNDVAGKSIVVHQKADDYTSQPAGNSGDRVACGVISTR